MTSKLEFGLPVEERVALRKSLIDATPSWYSPWAHIVQLSLWELLAIPVFYALNNIGEWWAHKHLLHRRHWAAPVLYDQHTPGHHMVYVTDDMAMCDRREFRLVLIPAYGILLIFLANLVPTLALWFAGLHNVALLFTATTMAFVLTYEWLHLAYHLPTSQPIGRMRVIAWLRHHHAVHHDPKLMQRWNFNVTVPFWDWVCRTMVKSAEEAKDRRRARPRSSEEARSMS
jgi:hypothetical protein